MYAGSVSGGAKAFGITSHIIKRYGMFTDEPKISPRLEVYVHRETNEYVILNNALSGQTGFYVNWGPLIYISKSQMEVYGFDIVLENLHGFYDRNGDVAECELNAIQVDNPPLYGRFLRLHKSIPMLRDDDEGVLEILPMCSPHRYSLDKRIIKVPLHGTHHEFLVALQCAEIMAE